MKLIATVTDCADLINAGGGVEARSVIIDLGEDLPPLLKRYLETRKWAAEGPNRYTYESLSFSVLEE